MSGNNIDERIVEMRFNNQQFESGVKESLGTLDRLKKGLDFDGAVKSLSALESAGKNFSLAGIGEAVEKISGKFTAMGIVAITALQNITNTAINAGKQMIKSLTIAPVSDGFQEYELVLNALQTTMAGTGKTMEEVGEELKRLDQYADDTVYSTKDMLANLPKFTNAGVQLEPAVTAMIGIANATALAGGGAQQASMAFYNLGQSIGTGYLTRMDYNSINLAGIATMEWKNQMISAAIAMGTLTKAGENQYKVNGKLFTLQSLFIDGLQEQWATTDVMMKVFGDYGDKTTEIGRKAYDAAQKIKTFTAMMEMLKATAGTGWKGTWDLIFGDLEEATRLWTGIGTAIGDAIKRNADARNGFLKTFKDLGGRDNILIILGNSLIALGQILKPIQEAFREIFPPMTAERLVEITESIKQFTVKLVESTKNIDGLKSTFKGIFAIFDIAFQVVKTVISAIGQLIGIFLPASTGIFKFTGSIGDWIVKLDEAIKKGTVFTDVIQKIIDFVKIAVDTVKDFVSNIDFSGIVEFGNSIKNTFANFDFSSVKAFASSFNKNIGSAGKGTFLEDLMNFFEKVGNFFKPFFKAIGDFFEPIIGNVKEFFKNFKIGGGDLKELLTQIQEVLITGIVGALGVALINLTNNLKKLTKTTKSLVDTVKDSLGAFKKYISAMSFDTISSGILKLAIAVAVLAGALFIISMIEPDRLVGSLSSLAALITTVVASLAVLEKMTSSPTSFHNIGRISILLIGLGLAVSLMASAMLKLKDLNIGDVAESIVAITFMLTAMAAMTKLLEKNEKTLIKEAIGFAAIGAALLVMAIAVQKFGEMDRNKLIQGGLAVSVLMTVLTGMGAVLGKVNFKASSGIGMLAIASALTLLYNVIVLFSGLDVESYKKGLLFVSGALIVLAGFTRAIKTERLLTASIAMNIISVALLEMLGVIKLYSLLEVDTLKRGILGVAGILVIIGGFTRLVDTSRIISLSAALVVMGVSLTVMAAALKILGGMSLEQIGAGLLGIAGLLTILGVAAFALAPVIPVVLNLGKSILMLGVGVALIGVGVYALSAGLLLLAGSAVSAAAAITIIGTAIAGLIVVFLTAVGTGILALAAVIAKGAPVIADAFIALIRAGLKALNTVVPEVVSGVFILIEALLEELDKHIPTITDKLFSIVIGFLKKVADNLPQLIKTGAEVIKAFFDGVMAAIGTFDSTNLLEALGAMAAILAILALFAASSVVALAGILGMTAVLAALGGLKQIPGLTWLINEGSQFMSLIGKALGEFVGSIVGGVLNKMSDAFPKTGTKLSEFMTNLQPFIDGIKTITPEMNNSIKTLVGAILGITASNVIDGLTSWLTGGSAIDNFALSLPKLGTAIREFSINVGSIDEKNVSSGANAIKILAEASKVVGKEGGLWGLLSGERDIDGFTESLPKLGLAIGNFSTNVGDIDENSVTLGANALKTLAEASKIVAKEGGVWGLLSGERDLEGFSLILPKLGTAIRDFSLNVGTDVREDSVLLGANAIKTLAEAANIVSKEGGVWGLIAGNRDIEGFGTILPRLGTAIREFSLNVGDLSTSSVGEGANAIKTLSEAAKTVARDGGVWGLIAGDRDIEGFSTILPKLGTAISEFSINVGDLKASSIIEGVNALKTLSEISAVVGLLGSKVGWMNDFGIALAKFGKSLVEYFNTVKDLNLGQVSGVIDQVNLMVDLANRIAGIDTAGMYNFSTTMTEVATQGISSFTSALMNSKLGIETAIDVMMGYAINEAKIKGFEFDGIGQNTIKGIAEGMRKQEKEPAKAIVDIMASAVNAVKNYLQINSPSRKIRDEIGVSIPEGAAEGITAKEYVAVDASTKLGKAIDKTLGTTITRATETKAGADNLLIDLGKQITGAAGDKGDDAFTTLMTGAEDTGKKVDENVGKGVSDSDASKEAIKKRAEEIVNAFKDAIDKANLEETTIGLEEKLWDALYGDSPDSVVANKKLDFINQKIMAQQDEVAAAQGEYQKMLETFGEDATVTKESYNRLLQAQIDLAELINQKKELMQDAAAANQTAMQEYYKIMTDEKLIEALKRSGYSMEEIEAWAREKTGFDPNATKDSVSGDIKTTLGLVTDAYAKGLNKMFAGELLKLFAKFGSSYAEELGKGFLKKFKEMIGEIKGSFKALEDEIVLNVQKIIDRVRETLDNADLTLTITVVLDTSALDEIGLDTGKSLEGAQEATVSGGNNGETISAGGKNPELKSATYSFTQINNSPTPISRIDLYRQTANQFSQFKRIVGDA